MNDDTFTAGDFESAASASSESAVSTSTPAESSAPGDTTTQPEGATTAPVVATTETQQPSTEPTAKTGPIPFDVHKTALENARTKAVEEALAPLAWARQVDPQEFQKSQQIARHFVSGDPIAGLRNLVAELRREDPNFDAVLRSEAGRMLAQRAQPVEQEPQPDLPIQLEDGRVVHLYSAEQQAKREAYLQQKWMQGVEQKLQPLQHTHEQMQAQREAERVRVADTEFATTTTADVKTWPGVTDEGMKAMALAVAKDPKVPRNPTYADLEAATHRAYRTVIVPSLSTASRQAVLNDINRQAAASTVNPALTSTRAPKSMDDMTIAEALQHVAAQQGA